MGSSVPTDPNLSPELQRFLDAQARANSTNSTDLAAAIATIPALASNAEAIAGVENTHFMSALRTAQAIAALTTVPAFTKSFVSSGQTITAAGALTLAHGLGTTPTLLAATLVNTTAELGYSIGDKFALFNSNVLSIVPDATNLNIRFGSVGPFAIPHKTTGVATTITNADWNIVFSAWA